MNSEKLKKLFQKEAFFGTTVEKRVAPEVEEVEEVDVFEKEEIEFVPTKTLSSRKDRLKRLANIK
jgi:hypothetical protein